MYFGLFKLKSWGKRSGSNRRRFISGYYAQITVSTGMSNSSVFRWGST